MVQITDKNINLTFMNGNDAYVGCQFHGNVIITSIKYVSQMNVLKLNFCTYYLGVFIVSFFRRIFILFLFPVKRMKPKNCNLCPVNQDIDSYHYFTF